MLWCFFSFGIRTTDHKIHEMLKRSCDITHGSCFHLGDERTKLIEERSSLLADVLVYQSLIVKRFCFLNLGDYCENLPPKCETSWVGELCERRGWTLEKGLW